MNPTQNLARTASHEEGVLRLAPNGSPAFNAAFLTDLKLMAAEIAQTMGNDLLAVVLGGGYGRLEGCVTRVNGQESAYNDVDLFLFTRTPRPRGREERHRIAQHYEHRLQIAVDFSHPITPSMVRNWAPLLMWQELAIGHQVLYGPQDILASLVPMRVLQPLPTIEASRLLLNRGAGLVWAGRVAEELELALDSSFVVRNYFKCAQSLGDAILLGCQRYASEPAVKQARLRQLADSVPIIQQSNALEFLASAYEFRACPYAEYSITGKDLRLAAHAWKLVFLWAESLRHGQKFRNVDQYVSWEGQREKGQISIVQSLAANLRRGRLGVEHPREKVYCSLPVAINHLATESPCFASSSAEALQQWKEAQ